MSRLQHTLLLLLVCWTTSLLAFTVDRTTRSSRLYAKPDTEPPNALTKASWYAVEAFGKVFGSADKNKSAAAIDIDINYDQPPQSLDETLARLRKDNDRQYFLSGKVDRLIFDKDCTFSDPFVSFKGRDRFVDNLANLGSFITKYSAKPIAYDLIDKDEENKPIVAVQSRFMVKLELNLPWKPVLAWPFNVKCVVDPETYQIVLHKETWDIEAWEGVKQIFRKPTVKIQ